jgi:hypothetical protein
MPSHENHIIGFVAKRQSPCNRNLGLDPDLSQLLPAVFYTGCMFPGVIEQPIHTLSGAIAAPDRNRQQSRKLQTNRGYLITESGPMVSPSRKSRMSLAILQCTGIKIIRFFAKSNTLYLLELIEVDDLWLHKNQIRHFQSK